MFTVSRRRRTLDIWPGFVDALAALVMVVIFVLLLFTLGQFFLNQQLEESESALDRLDAEVTRLSELLSLERAESARLENQVTDLSASLSAAERRESELDESLEAARDRIASMQSEIGELESRRETLRSEVGRLSGELEEERSISAEARAEVERLNRQITELRTQLTQVSEALDLSRETVAAQEEKIEDLGERLNVALAEKVEDLKRYRSDFFGRLKEVLGDNPDIRVVGDRFVFQSELLFDTASAELGPDGRRQVAQMARTLKEVMPRIPDDIDWVLRVDGHTDARPIRTAEYPSNWELSTARSVAIVKHLAELGVPPGRMAATGFGPYHPLDPADTPEAWAKNRRIELKLTSR